MKSWRPAFELQIETWGYDESDVIPRKTFLVAQTIGGQVIGAFDTELAGGGQGAAEALVGFVFSLPGVKTGEGEPRAYLHSHMLAVKEAYRNRGLGRQLKLEQRREALARGHPVHGVDVRSAGDQERIFEYPQAGSDGFALSCGFLWCILISTAGWVADGPFVGGVAA